MKAVCPQCRDRIETLEEEVRQLRDALAQAERPADAAFKTRDALVNALAATPQLRDARHPGYAIAAITTLYLRRVALSATALGETISPHAEDQEQFGRLAIHAARRVLGYEAIHTVHGVGYVLTAAGRAMIERMVTNAVEPEAVTP